MKTFKSLELVGQFLALSMSLTLSFSAAAADSGNGGGVGGAILSGYTVTASFDKGILYSELQSVAQTCIAGRSLNESESNDENSFLYKIAVQTGFSNSFVRKSVSANGCSSEGGFFNMCFWAEFDDAQSNKLYIQTAGETNIRMGGKFKRNLNITDFPTVTYDKVIENVVYDSIGTPVSDDPTLIGLKIKLRQETVNKGGAAQVINHSEFGGVVADKVVANLNLNELVGCLKDGIENATSKRKP